MRALTRSHKFERDAGASLRESIESQMDYYTAKVVAQTDPVLRKLYELQELNCIKALERLDGCCGDRKSADLRVCTAPLQIAAVQPTLSQILLRMIDEKPRAVDGIIFASGAPAGEVLSELLKLELVGKVRKLPGNRYSRK